MQSLLTFAVDTVSTEFSITACYPINSTNTACSSTTSTSSTSTASATFTVTASPSPPPPNTAFCKSREPPKASV